jgi:hypothetical protein
MSRLRATALAAVCAGLALSQQACGTDDGSGSPSPQASALPSAEPTSAVPTSKVPNSQAPDPKAPDPGPAGASAILGGDRQVVIKPVPAAESILAVTGQGRLNATDGGSEFTLFVLSPAADGKHLIKTAETNASGEPSCMGVKSNGRNPLTVAAAACDAGRAGQLFTIAKAEKTDNGRPTYAISNQGAFLQLSAKYGLIAEELGDSPLPTTFAFVDNGKSPLAE